MMKKRFMMVLVAALVAFAAFAAFAGDVKTKVKLDTCMFAELRGKTIEVMYTTDYDDYLCDDCDGVETVAHKLGGYYACLEKLDGFTGLVSADQKLLGVINKYHQVLSKECIIGKTKTGHYYIIRN